MHYAKHGTFKCCIQYDTEYLYEPHLCILCLILHTKKAKQPTWRSLVTDVQLSRYWLSVMCPDAVLQCTVRDTVTEGNSGETLFFFFFSLFLVKFHSWRRAVNDNRRGCAPSGKTLAGETERRTYGWVQWTDRETWTRLIISSCVINLDLNTIGREAQWTRHPTDRSICLHWWICSHTYMCTHAAAHRRAHTHTHPYKWARWVSLCFAKLPNPPPR